MSRRRWAAVRTVAASVLAVGALSANAQPASAAVTISEYTSSGVTANSGWSKCREVGTETTCNYGFVNGAALATMFNGKTVFNFVEVMHGTYTFGPEGTTADVFTYGNNAMGGTAAKFKHSFLNTGTASGTLDFVTHDMKKGTETRGTGSVAVAWTGEGSTTRYNEFFRVVGAGDTTLSSRSAGSIRNVNTQGTALGVAVDADYGYMISSREMLHMVSR